MSLFLLFQVVTLLSSNTNTKNFKAIPFHSISRAKLEGSPFAPLQEPYLFDSSSQHKHMLQTLVVLQLDELSHLLHARMNE